MGVVAVLVRIRNGEGEGAENFALTGVMHDDLLGMPGAPGISGGAQIAEKTATPELVETLRDFRFEADAGCGEKRVSVGEPGVDDPRAPVQQNIEGPRGRAVQTEVAPQTVARSARHQTECGRRADELTRHFVHGAVATHRHDQVAAIAERGVREFRGVAGALGQSDAGGVSFGESSHARQVARGATGAEVDDETRFQRRKSLLTTDYTDATDWKNKTVPPPPLLHVLTGPTAVGKTEWALRWAEQHNAEIVSCDSLLFYRGMDIGTAKPTAAERARVPHHLIDICDVTQQASITYYVTRARAAVADILGRGRAVLVTGGSGFYLKAFFAPVADDVAVPAPLRDEVRALALPEALAQLLALNPAGLGELDRANPRRVMRALERCRATGRTLADLAADFARQPAPFAEYRVALTRLERDPAELAFRIEQRVGAMLEGGLVDEVKRLRVAGLEQNSSASGAIGYREVLAALDGRLLPAQLAETIAQNTRALVKKQRTWFRTQLPPHRELNAGAVRSVSELFGMGGPA